MALAPGQILDAKYRVGRLIGEGGMGTVYEGENTRIGRRVAIKVLHAQVASMAEFVERFEREARAAARIGSPHVCDVIDLGDLPSGDRYIVMEYLDGASFEDRLEECGRMTPAQLAPIAFELLDGLGTMHAARVIHRDLKPANVFLAKTSAGRGEIVKILDFGVAKLLPTVGEVGSMTQTGMMMGTPLYMSPEQARGAKDVDGRTDIYAASVMFYRALTGVLPHAAESLNELLFKIVLEDPTPIRQLAPEVDEGFAAMVHKGLARDVEERFRTARDYQAAVAAWGKAQGRTHLSFAVTVPSEPPPPMAVPLPGGDGSRAAKLSNTPVSSSGSSGASSGANSGTPTAWSDDGPEVAQALAEAAKSTGDAPRPAAGAAAQPITDASKITGPRSAAVAAEAAELAMATTTAIPSDPPPPMGPRSEEAPGVPSPQASQATTDPSRVAPSFARADGSTKPGAGRSSRLVIGGLGAAAIVAIAVVALGRGGPAGAGGVSSGGPRLEGSSPSASLSSAATSAGDGRADPKNAGSSTAVLAAASAAAAASASNAELATADGGANGQPPAGTGPGTGPGTGTTGSLATARHDLSAGAVGKKPLAQPSATGSATTAAVPAADPAASAGPAKPAASGRRYRTNLD